jgi:hypothetical protein
VLDGVRGQLARQIHETYREGDPGGPYDVLWTQLTREGRRRNLAHADAIARQLEEVGYHLGPMIDWGAAPLEFTEAEVEEMSRVEHERWVTERASEGWKRASAKDYRARQHPDLVPWAELPEERRDVNRRLVRARPAMLARVGIQVYRD